MFYLLSVFALSAGLLALQTPKYSIVLLGIMLAVVPTGNAYSEIISLNGIYFFDFYVAGATLALLVRQVVAQSPQLIIGATQLCGCAVYLALLVLGLFDNPDKFLLKDTRPFIMMLSFIVLANVASLAAQVLTLKTILKILIAMTVLNGLDLAWLRLGLYSFQDVYYEENAYRYLDGGAYAAAAFLIYYFIDPRLFEGERKLATICVITSFLCLFIANSRFIMISAFIAIIIHQYTRPFRLLGISILGAMTMLAFLEISALIGADRISDTLSSADLEIQLATRFSPAWVLTNEMTPVHYFVGLGAGTSFEIPWFAYRGLDDRNANIDSAYLTYFVKYGIIGCYLLFVFITSVTGHLTSRVAVSIATFLALMFIVSATPYQPYAIGIAYAVIVLRGFSAYTSKHGNTLPVHQMPITLFPQVKAR